MRMIRTPRNGYGELVRLGRSRGWVTLADINDYLPESALRTSENLQEVTEQLGRLGIQVFETPPDEDDILINGMGGDNSDDIDEDDAGRVCRSFKGSAACLSARRRFA